MKKNKVITAAIFASLFLIGAAGILKSAAETAESEKEYREWRKGTPAQIQTEDLSGFLDFAALQKQNPDVVGWIRIEGTAIDYPLLQSEDNAYYLNHTLGNKKNKAGSLFLDYRNKGDFSDYNTIIYGHNMRDGTMFADLNKYAEEEYWKAHGEVELLTPSGKSAYEIIFAGQVADDDRVYDRISAGNGPDTRLTLSTCVKNRPDRRMIIIARKKT